MTKKLTDKEITLNILCDKPVAYRPDITHALDSIQAGIFLSQLFYWTDRQHDPDGWIYKTQEEWAKETGLKRPAQETARKRLQKLGILEEKRDRLAAKMYYRINFSLLQSVLRKYYQEIAPNAGIQHYGEAGSSTPLLQRVHSKSTITPPAPLPGARKSTPDLRSETQNTPPSGKEPEGKGSLKVFKNRQSELLKYYTPSGTKEKKLLKVISNPDYKIIEQLPEIFDNHEVADELETLIDNILSTKGVPKALREKLKHLEDILKKSEKTSLLYGISVIKQRNKGNSLSYLKRTIERNQGLHKKEKGAN